MYSYFKNNLRLLSHCNISKERILFVYFLSLLITILETFGIGMLLPIGEYLLNSQSQSHLQTTSWKLIYKIFDFLNLTPSIKIVVALAIITIIVRQICTYTKLIVSAKIQYEIAKTLRRNLFASLIKTDLKHSKNLKTGANANLATTEIHNAAIAGVSPFDIITAILLLLSYFMIMTILSWQATVFIVSFGFLVGALVRLLNKKIDRLSEYIIDINNDFTQHFVERLRAIKLIKLNHMYDKEYASNYNILHKQYKTNMTLTKIYGITATGLEPLVIAIVLPGLILSVHLGASLTLLGMFAIILARLIPTFKVMIEGLQTYIRFNASSERILLSIIESQNKQEYRLGTKKFPTKFKKISLNNITFRHLDSKNFIFKNFSATLQAGKINAIIGSSGVGKTTLVDMLPLLLQPSSGKIKIGSIDITEINIKSLRNNFAYVDQSPFFFKGSIMENLTYSQSKINTSKCIEAAKLAKAHSFIIKLPLKYNYLLGETGTGLSGGQLQRLEIAKALATGRKIIILDEPTSNLDSKSSEDILKTIVNINKKTDFTFVIISHKQDISKYCNHLIKL